MAWTAEPKLASRSRCKPQCCPRRRASPVRPARIAWARGTVENYRAAAASGTLAIRGGFFQRVSLSSRTGHRREPPLLPLGGGSFVKVPGPDKVLPKERWAYLGHLSTSWATRFTFRSWLPSPSQRPLTEIACVSTESKSVSLRMGRYRQKRRNRGRARGSHPWPIHPSPKPRRPPRRGSPLLRHLPAGAERALARSAFQAPGRTPRRGLAPTPRHRPPETCR